MKGTMLVLAALMIVFAKSGYAYGIHVSVDEGYVLAIDGSEGNPDPGDGFVSVGDDGTVCVDDNGSPEFSDTPTCAGGGGQVCDVPGCLTVLGDEYVLAFDGDAGNPDPTDGFVSVSYDGVVCVDEGGSPESPLSPTCVP